MKLGLKNMCWEFLYAFQKGITTLALYRLANNSEAEA